MKLERTLSVIALVLGLITLCMIDVSIHQGEIALPTNDCQTQQQEKESR